MPTWSSVAEDASLPSVEGRLPHHVIDASSSPSNVVVGQWLDYAEARMRSVLAAAGLRTSYNSPADDDAIAILGEKACDYAEGRFRRAKASLEGDDENLDGQLLIDSFEAFISRIEDEPVLFGAELEAGDVAESQRAFRSHVTDLGADLDDFAPRVEMSKVYD